MKRPFNLRHCSLSKSINKKTNCKISHRIKDLLNGAVIKIQFNAFRYFVASSEIIYNNLISDGSMK